MHAFAMKRTILLSALLLVLLAMAFWLWSAMTGNDHRTDDAWVNADYTLVAPKVSGYIAHVNVQDNQRVRAGDVLATLDDRDYRVALETARANLQVSDAKRLSAQAQLDQQQSTIAEARVHAGRQSGIGAVCRTERGALQPAVQERHHSR
jgi:Multidrug resistance efflux pump